MQNVIRNVFVGAGVLVLSVVIFFLISEDRELKQDVYNHALNLMGEQLLAMLPEDAPETEATEVSEKWERFSEQARKGEVPPEQVERVAVRILNASNAEAKLSPEEANMMLDIAIAGPQITAMKGEARGMSASVSVSTSPGSEERIHELPPPVPSERYHELGDELMTVLQFNSQVKEHLKHASPKSEVLQRNLHYQFDNGLKIEIDSELRKELSDNEIQKELTALQKKKIVEWRQNLSRELEELHLQRMQQLDSLRIRLEKDEVELQGLDEGQRQELLISLQKLHKLDAVDGATIEQMITENMRELHMKLQKLEQKKQSRE